MKTSISVIVICSCVLIFVNGCKHKKSAASKQKDKNHHAVIKSPNMAPKTSSSAETAASDRNTAELEQKLGLTGKDIKNSKLFLFINDWYGVPYKYGGCQKTGVDCSCFTNLLYDRVYNKKTARSADEMYNDCEKIVLDEIREGDLVFFKINSTLVSHVGVYLRNNLFVHSSTSKGVVISSVQEAYYRKYFHSGGRIRNS